MSSSIPKVVSREEWTLARKELLRKEKEHTRQRDELSRQRRALPWVCVDKSYDFTGPEGKVPLAKLFKDRSQLIIYHFMFAPGWDAGCVGCSFVMDHVQASLVHLNQKDVSFVCVSRAPLAEIEAFKRRMGWSFDWVSSFGSDFNYDYQASYKKDTKGKVYHNFEMRDFESEEQPGASVFQKSANGTIYHTYSSYGRGLEDVLGTYVLLDLLPKGREEAPGTNLASWVRHHDRYEHAPVEAGCGCGK